MSGPDVNHGAQDVLNRMKAAHQNERGMRITADELHALSVTIIGQMWDEDDPVAALRDPASDGAK